MPELLRLGNVTYSLVKIRFVHTKTGEYHYLTRQGVFMKIIPDGDQFRIESPHMSTPKFRDTLEAAESFAVSGIKRLMMIFGCGYLEFLPMEEEVD